MSASVLRILVVDDEDCVRSLLKCALSGPGWKVLDAACADEALELAADNGPFDLVVSDVIMPGMDGVDLAAELYQRGHASAFLLISGYCEADHIRERLDGIRPCSFLPKPFTIPDLLVAVRELFPAAVVHTASLRDHRHRRALHRVRTRVDRSVVLRRISAKLRKTGQRALGEANVAARRNRVLRLQMQQQSEWIWALNRKLERQRVIVESCSSLFRDQ